jgi:hypothetical protein
MDSIGRPSFLNAVLCSVSAQCARHGGARKAAGCNMCSPMAPLNARDLMPSATADTVAQVGAHYLKDLFDMFVVDPLKVCHCINVFATLWRRARPLVVGDRCHCAMSGIGSVLHVCCGCTRCLCHKQDACVAGPSGGHGRGRNWHSGRGRSAGPRDQHGSAWDRYCAIHEPAVPASQPVLLSRLCRWPLWVYTSFLPVRYVVCGMDDVSDPRCRVP